MHGLRSGTTVISMRTSVWVAKPTTWPKDLPDTVLNNPHAGEHVGGVAGSTLPKGSHGDLWAQPPLGRIPQAMALTRSLVGMLT